MPSLFTAKTLSLSMLGSLPTFGSSEPKVSCREMKLLYGMQRGSPTPYVNRSSERITEKSEKLSEDEIAQQVGFSRATFDRAERLEEDY